MIMLFVVPYLQKLIVVFSLLNFICVLSENPEERGNYMEGDILSVAPSLEAESNGLTRSGILNQRYRWPNATIPFEFSRGYPDHLKLQFYNATEHISNRTCLKFKPRSNERDSILLVTNRGCASHVGRIGRRQIVSLSRDCNSLGTFVHEIIHAAGFYHEQSRRDRDKYVTIHYQNIRPGMQHNFNNLRGNRFSEFEVPYDYDSVMHYTSTAFSRNGRNTIEPKKEGVTIGNRNEMSKYDIEKINKMYCNDKVQREEERPLKLM